MSATQDEIRAAVDRVGAAERRRRALADEWDALSRERHQWENRTNALHREQDECLKELFKAKDALTKLAVEA